MIKERIAYLFEIVSVRKEGKDVVKDKIGLRDALAYYLIPFVFYITVASLLTTLIVLPQQADIVGSGMGSLLLFCLIWLAVFAFSAALGYGLALGVEYVLCALFKLMSRVHGKKVLMKSIYPAMLTVGGAVTLASLPIALVQPLAESSSMLLSSAAAIITSILATLVFAFNLYLEYQVIRALTGLSKGKSVTVILGAYLLLVVAALSVIGLGVLIIGIELVALQA